MKKFFIIAGEASGDLLGSKVIDEIKSEMAKRNEECLFMGIGGQKMIEKGLNSFFDISHLSVMGFIEVIPHIAKLLNIITIITEKIIAEKPDYLITIDSPDFNFRVVKKYLEYVQNNHTKKIHIIAPTVWAYRPGRAKKIAKLYDLLLVILPFEPPYFEKYGLRTIFVGHPIVEDAPDFLKKPSINLEFRKKHNLQDSDTLLLVTPGSRISEVKQIFPEFIGAINLLSKNVSNLKAVILVTESTKNLVNTLKSEMQIDTIVINQEEKNSALYSANYALAKSGTNNVEIAMFKIPMVIGYKVNKITYLIAKLLIKIKFINIINILLNKFVINEMIQNDCSQIKITEKLLELITNKEVANQQISESQIALKMLGLNSNQKSAKKIVTEILS